MKPFLLRLGMAGSLAMVASAVQGAEPPYYQIELIDQLPLPGITNGWGFGEGVHGAVLVGWQTQTGFDVGLPVMAQGGVVTQLPGSPLGAAVDVNAAGVMVGFGLAALDQPRFAVRWIGGAQEALAGLGTASEARAVNAGGAIAGWTIQPSGRRAFVWNAGTVTILPTLGDAEAFDINTFGHVTGWAQAGDGQRHAFLWKDGVLTDLGTLGGVASEGHGLTDGGVVVGSITLASGKKRPFRWQAGSVQELGLVTGANEAEAWSANDLGDAVGGSSLIPGIDNKAIVWRDGVAYDLTLRVVAGDPVEDILSAVHIDAEGRITGVAYTPFAQFRAYVATPVPKPQFEYDVIEIPPPPGATALLPTALNDLGHVVGYAVFPTTPIHRAFLWTPQAGSVVLPMPPGYDNRWIAKDINNAGVIAGDSGSGGTDLAWRYENGAYSFIPILPGYGPASYSTADGIAPNGDVASTSGDFSGPPPGSSAVLAPYGGGLVELDQGSSADGINAVGQVIFQTEQGEAWRYTPGVGNELISVRASVRGINDLGQVTGGHDQDPGAAVHGIAYLYTDGVGMQFIVNISDCASDDFDRGIAVNNHGVVAGISCMVGIANGWVWSAEKGVRLLDDVIDPALPYFLDEPVDINNEGQILVLGSHQVQGGSRVFLLTPTPHCQQQLGFGGPGAMFLSLCGDALVGGGQAELSVSGGPAHGPLLLLASASFLPTPAFGGTLVPMPPQVAIWLALDASGSIAIPGIPGGGGPLTVYAQTLALDPNQPKVVAISNAISVALLP